MINLITVMPWLCRCSSQALQRLLALSSISDQLPSTGIAIDCAAHLRSRHLDDAHISILRTCRHLQLLRSTEVKTAKIWGHSSTN